MKVLVLSDLWQPFPGGAERFLYNIAVSLMQRGAEVDVLTSYGKMFGSRVDTCAIALGGLPVHFRNIGCRSNNRHEQGWDCIKTFLAEAKPDVILTHQFFPDEFRTELAAVGLPIVQVVHAAPVWPYVNFAIYNSEHTRQRNEPVWDCHSSHPPGQHLAKCNQVGGVVIHPPAFDDCVSPYHGKAIGFIKPVEHKGVDLVYRLARALPNRHFVILRGEWWHFDKLVDLPNVEYMAPVDEMRDFYRRCQLILVPSLYEDAGTVSQEATLNGLPCLSTGQGGLAETNRGGIILPYDDEMLWIGTIEDVLTFPDIYARIVNRQRQHLQSFAWPQKFDALYQRMKALV